MDTKTAKRIGNGRGEAARALLALLLSACSSDSGPASSAAGPSHGRDGGPMGSPSSTSTSVVIPGPPLPTPDGGADTMPGTTTLPLSNAPDLPSKVKASANRSSVLLYLPGVSGAKDYRVFAVEDGVTVSTDAALHEHVAGATIHCAGLRQRNQCDEGEVLPVVYNNDLLDMGHCDNPRHPNVPTALMQTLEVDGVKPNTTLVVEAIDRQCPFPGLFGTEHLDVKIVGGEMPGTTENVTVNGSAYTIQRWQPTFPVMTEAEIRAKYGSMILNGEGPNNPDLTTTPPESPYIRLAQAAPADDPVVLGRAVIQVSPTGTDKLPDSFTDTDTFDDFADPADQPTLVRKTDYLTSFLSIPFDLYKTKNWLLYNVGNEFSQFFVDRGQLDMVSGDPGQGSMSAQAMYPIRPVKLPDLSDTGKYLHVTYEVQRIETPRRYENLTLCGSDQAGQTYDTDGTLKSAPLPRPGFMNETDTARTSPLGWNCLYLIPRGAGYGPIPGGDVDSHSDSSLKITVVKSHTAPPTIDQYDRTHITEYATAFGPTQESPFPLRWERQIDANKQPSGPWLDDKMNVWQRAKFDVFIRRDQVVLYVDGQQRICQNLTASPLTMAEGALGFWHILYHTSAEFLEIRAHQASDNPTTGLHHVLHNTPFGDERTYDNVGFREGVALPADFDQGRCL